MKANQKVIVWLKWLLYAAFTQNARTRYMVGLSRGMHCTRMVHDMTGSDVWFDPNKKPVREYLTRKEFFANNA